MGIVLFSLIEPNNTVVKDGKTRILQVTFAEYWSLDNMTNLKDRNFSPAKTIIGNIDQFKSRFEIIQRVKI